MALPGYRNTGVHLPVRRYRVFEGKDGKTLRPMVLLQLGVGDSHGAITDLPLGITPDRADELGEILQTAARRAREKHWE